MSRALERQLHAVALACCHVFSKDVSVFVRTTVISIKQFDTADTADRARDNTRRTALPGSRF